MKKLLLTAALTFYSTFSFGGSCIGYVDEIQQGYNGRVSLISNSLYSDNHARDICRLDQEWQGVSAETCKGWLSALMLGYTSNKKVWVQYGGSASCSSIEHWTAATRPNAIRLAKD